jgi:transposase
MYESGVSVREIADKEGMTRHAIYGVIRRYPHQQSAKDNKRSGRPPILTERDKSHIKILIKRNAFISYR